MATFKADDSVRIKVSDYRADHPDGARGTIAHVFVKNKHNEQTYRVLVGSREWFYYEPSLAPAPEPPPAKFCEHCRARLDLLAVGPRKSDTGLTICLCCDDHVGVGYIAANFDPLTGERKGDAGEKHAGRVEAALAAHEKVVEAVINRPGAAHGPTPHDGLRRVAGDERGHGSFHTARWLEAIATATEALALHRTGEREPEPAPVVCTECGKAVAMLMSMPTGRRCAECQGKRDFEAHAARVKAAVQRELDAGKVVEVYMRKDGLRDAHGELLAGGAHFLCAAVEKWLRFSVWDDRKYLGFVPTPRTGYRYLTGNITAIRTVEMVKTPEYTNVPLDPIPPEGE